MSASSPTISRRYGIAWSSTPFTTAPSYTEPTSTIVVSSPSGQFVDLRIVLKSPAKDASVTPTSLELGSNFKELEWAIAGQATFSTTPEGKKHGMWSHWISSRESGNGDVDEGDMEPPDEHGRVVETGQMVNSEVGKRMWYKEVWGDVVQKMPDAVPGAVTGKGKRSYVVVRCEDEVEGVRGLIIWVGQYCQGVLVERGSITAERWEYDFSSGPKKGEWIRTFRVGHGHLPCGWLVKESDEIRRGETLQAPDFSGDPHQWTITDEDFST